MKSMLARLLAVVLALSLALSPVAAQGATPTGPRQVNTGDRLISPDAAEGKSGRVSGEFKEETAVSEIPVNEKGQARYIVILPDAPLAAYKGEVAGFAPTAPSVIGANKLDVTSAASQSYLAYLKDKQANFLTAAEKTLGVKPEVLFTYRYATNGFSMLLTPDEATRLAAQTGVKVLLAPVEHPDTDQGPQTIGAPAIWNGEDVSGVGTKGEGVLVGIIDTGINFDHPSFSDTPADGYTYSWTGDYLGVCNPATGDPDYADACNDKLVGAFTYVLGDPDEIITPEDSEGHGSHTASTVAGNTVDVTFEGVETTISGVAPHAQIISFDVCVPTPPNGACYGDATVAAVEDAMLSGVDVINYSISGGSNPYGDPVELAFLAATEAGIFVSTSAGNAGDTTGKSSVAHRSPWVSTVAAATHARVFANALDITGPGDVPPELVGLGAYQSGAPITSDLVNLPIKYSPTNLNGCAAFPAGFFAGSFALIARGTCTFAVKEANARNAGATYVFIYNNRTGPPVGMSGVISAAMLSMDEGLAVKAWIDANPTATATLHADTSRIVNPAWQDIVASFSSFGPNTSFDVLKPDITAPGVNILAAVADGTIAPSGDYELELYQGTSMSSPHNAGAAALMKALHPTWTPMEIRSAMMMTAHDGLLADRSTWGEGVRPATPQDEGAGRVALHNTALVGLVMNETIANFEAADPSLDGNPATLNLASLYNSKCVGECTWTRTFKSVAGVPATYTAVAPEWVTVTPSSFTIPAGGTQTVTITADVSAFDTDIWKYTSVTFETTDIHVAPSLLTERFSGTTFPPAGWRLYNNDSVPTVNWARTTTYYASAPASARHTYSCTANQEGWLVTPKLSLPAEGPIYLHFNQRGNYVADIEYHGIMVSTSSQDPASGVFVELAVPPAPTEDTWTTAPVSIDLAAYAGLDVYLAFKYTGNCADEWWIDDVEVGSFLPGPQISNVHIPMAVLPVASNIPTFVRFESHRDAGGEILDDLMAVAITDGNVYKSGLVKADIETFTLDPDPTPGNPVDDVNQVFVKKFVVPAYTIRLVAEITASTSQDIDMFLYYDLDGNGVLTSADYRVASSATSAVLEYLNAPKNWIYYDVEDTYFIVVQNWSGAPGDSVTLASGMVPLVPEVGNYDVAVPATNPAGQPFSIAVTWNEDTQEGDRLYGYFDTCADTYCDNWIGSTDIDIVRSVNDVVKTADVAAAQPGDVITYTIDLTNYAETSSHYSLTDTLPNGVTYVDGSATGGAVYDPVTNTISWEGDILAGGYRYLVSTSAEDPACTLAIMPDGDPTDDYLDWKTTSYGFSTISSISGDSKWYSTFASYPPFNYYGVDYTGMEFTDDGYAGFDMVDVDYVNQEIPDPLDPNNVLAMFWTDLQIQYDAATNKGVTMVGNSASFATIEYDDLFRWGEDPGVTLDVEVGYFLQVDDAPGAYEIVYAFDNVNPALLAAGSATIGLENVDGTEGVLISYNDPALTIEDGSAICFDWKYVPAAPHIITFQVTVNGDAPHGALTNEVIHSNDLFGTLPESAFAVVEIGSAPVASDDVYTTVEDTTLTVSAPGVLANDTDADLDPLSAVLVGGAANGVVTLNPDGSFEYIPNADFTGTDSFTYVANDSVLDSELATVTITVTPVNDSPIAVDDAYELDEDTVLTVDAPGVLANDVDVDLDNMVATLVSDVTHGTLVLFGNGSFTYTPAPDFYGEDTFVYRLITYPATIMAGWTDDATVTITVNPVNDAPVAANDTYSTSEDTELAVLAAGVLTNDTDVEGDPLTAVLAAGPTHGSLTLNADGSFTYMPDADFFGSDSFTYTANDGQVDSNTATVTIEVGGVNDWPVANDDAYETTAGVTLDVAAPGVLDNDVLLDPNETVTLEVTDAPAHGTLTLNNDGSFTYVPAPNFFGVDSFGYQLTSRVMLQGEFTDTAVVTITVLPVASIFLPMIVN